MTDERKEGQQTPPLDLTYWRFKDYPDCDHHSDGYVCGPCAYRSVQELFAAQPEPRGSEALREALQSIADIAVGHGDVCEIIAKRARAALAAATAERTPPQNPLDIAYNAIWKLWDKDSENQQLSLALQAIQRIGQPAPPQPEDWDYLVAKWLVQQKSDFHWNQQKVIEFAKWAIRSLRPSPAPHGGADGDQWPNDQYTEIVLPAPQEPK